jgi:hypothetical protein
MARPARAAVQGRPAMALKRPLKTPDALRTLELAMPAGAVNIGPEHPSNHPHEDVCVAIRNAFRAARRELELQVRGEEGGAR